jgi:hypothetical protein
MMGLYGEFYFIAWFGGSTGGRNTLPRLRGSSRANGFGLT